jgi:8-oxo-dGTP diphosphatase
VSRVVDVAVAILVRADGAVLLAQRPPDKVYGGWWEFPGGKVEPGEAPAQALARELREELGVHAEWAAPWVTRSHRYEHAQVRLHFFRVFRWSGTPHGREGQAVAWERIGAWTLAPVLPANGPVLKGLALPAEYAISNASDVGEARFLQRLERRLGEGLRLLQLRENALPHGRRLALARQVLDRTRSIGAIVLVNRDEALAREVGAHGVHLTAMQLADRSTRPDFEWVGASVHSADELRRAEALGVDFAVLGPVQATASHPGATPLGWEGFERVAHDSAVPVFAIGGLRSRDLATALARGAHGVAMIRGAWVEADGREAAG